MKKISTFRIILLLIVSLIVIVIILLGMGSIHGPKFVTAEMTGRITDATTGKPIENAVVAVKWYYSFPISIDTVSHVYKTQIAVTDAQGNYKIPSETYWHFFKSITGNRVSIIHPLYTSYGKGDVRDKKPIRFDIKLLSLDERYNQLKNNIEYNTTLRGYFDSYDSGGYFLLLKQKGIKFNLNKIFSKWDKLSKRFPEEIHYNQLQTHLNDSKNKIKNKLN
ncbi:MAG: carboxypeptidase regulatory-like domain-containing protein [Elusimicrobia bacterium]|nr:carboxypeptidase regulatory-like domain-containing protein [Elusimicrobiota bacterium]